MKDLYSAEGTITEVGDLVEIKRVGKPILVKRIVSFKSEGDQVIHFEIRNAKLDEYPELEDLVGVNLEIDFFFDGSEKGEVKYNNIVINNIRVI